MARKAWTPEALGLLLLIPPPLFWAGNFIVGRAMRGEVPPFTLSFWRWVIAFVCLLPFAWPHIRQWTAAANGLLLNSFIPILIVLLGAVFFGQRLQPVQALGLAVSFAGVLTIILHGDWGRLLALEFSLGDVVVFAAMVSWALYTLWLRGIPPEIDRIGLMAVQIGVAFSVLVPLYLAERAFGYAPRWNPESFAALAYLGVFPSVLAYLFYNIGVARVGPARAGMFIHLIPAFGVALAVLFLGETVQGYHLAGIAAILAGIGCTALRINDSARRSARL